MRDTVRIDIETVAGRQNFSDHFVHPTKERLMLRFFVAESDQSLQRNLITEPVVMAQLKDLGVNEALD